MTSVRKKKKPKCDSKASEQMRNWLTKHKNKKNTHPVTFSLFSKTVQNLPDIAFQIQCQELGFANKTLDECALWYYNAFYSDPSVRTKYEFRLRSCPQSVKEKLLQVGIEKASTKASCEDDNNNERVPTADGYEVKVNKSGRFLFPVSFSTFERYVNKEEVLDMLVQKETKDKAKCAAMLTDDDICRRLLRKYYNGFYIFPSRGQLKKVKFARAPPALKQQLMKRGIPLDELAMTTLEKKSKPPKSSKSLLPVANELSRCSIISFVIFEKFIKNIYDIVWRLKLNDPEFAYKGFEDCAYEYYLAFYLTPEIREKYPYQLAPCTTAMKKRILALPSPDDAKVLLRLKNQAEHLSASQQSEPQTDDVQNNQPTAQTEIAEDPAMECDKQKPPNEVAPPVTFEFFKRFITNLDQIVQKMLACDEYKGRTQDECALEYFRKFYSDPEIREQFSYQLKPCPGRIREKLLSLPFNVDALCCYKSSNEKNPVLTAEPELVTVGGKTYEFLVSFETFLRYINHDELITQLVHAYEKKKRKSGNKPSNIKLMNRFYHSFYIDVKVREEFNYNFNAAPAQLRETLMKPALPIASKGKQTPDREGHSETTTPTELCVVSEGQKEKVAQIENSDAEIDVMTSFVWQLDVIEDLGKAGRFMFPVSFETFRHCINYDDLIGLLLTRVTQDDLQLAAMITNPMHPQRQKIFKRYYRSFYVRPNTRSLYEYRFKIESANELQKLMAYAVPLDEKAKKTVAEAANEVALATENRAQNAINEQSEGLPVKFTLFKRLIKNLDEIVKQMLSCEDYSGRSEDECALEYFIAFYTDPQIRERFKYDLKPCPAQLRDKLLMLPVIMPETQIQQQPDMEERNPDVAQSKESEPEPEPEEALIEVCALTPETPDGICISGQNNNKEMLVQSERILITLEGITYEFPVSLQTFKRFINYDTVSVELANSYLRSNPRGKKNLREKRFKLVLLRRFYHSFYVDANIRKLCNFNFNAAPLEMQQKLLQFAIPCTQNVLTSSPLPTQCADSNNENLTDAITGDPVAEQRIDQVLEEEVEVPQSRCNAAIEYPISYNIFSKILNLDEVVEQMQQETPYSKMTANECRLAFFDAFYRTPEIRAKYKCTLKPCPALLRAKLLQVPQGEARTMFQHTYSKSAPENCQNTESVAVLYAARKAELARMDKSNVVKYTPHNLSAYIALRTQCPMKRSLLEKHFIGTQKQQQKKTVPGVEEALTLEQSTGAAAKTQCAKVVVASQCETSATHSAIDREIEIVSDRDLSTALTSKRAVTTITKTTTTAIRTETTTIQTVESSGKAAEIGTSAITAQATVTSTAPASSAAAVTTASTVFGTDLIKPTCSSETTSQSNASEASISNVESTGTALKAATASMSIPADKALQSTAGTCAGMVQNKLHGRTIDEINLPPGKEQNTLASTTNPTDLNPSIVAKAEAVFFAESSEEHNMKYLLCTSHGLKKTIWRILSQLSYTEFKTYTNIYADASLYKDESFLGRCYNHVLEKGNWPVNLFVKLQMLPQLLRSKGVQLDALDLGQLSPKMLHWQELIRFSNFQDIVERFFKARTGHEIDDMQELFNEIDNFYSMCWSSDKWIYQVPQITEELIQSIIWTENVTNTELIPPVTKPLCMIGDSTPAIIMITDSPEENLEATKAAETTGSALNANIALEESDCPHTQLNLSLCPPCFVDMGNVCPASQVMEFQNDPLNESSISTAANPVPIKQEKVKFLSNIRFTFENSENEKYNCEPIPNEIINLDTEENEQEAAKLACFAMNTTLEGNTTPISCNSNLHLSKDFSQDVLADVQQLADVLPSPTDVMWATATTQSELQASSAPMEVTPMEITPMEVPPMEITPMEVPPMEITPMEVPPNPIQPTATASRPIIPKPQMPATMAISRKKPRLMADNVPQLRHEFRPLPLTAMVRIEADGVNTYLNKQQSPQQDVATSSNQVQQLPSQSESRNTMTVSQELATDKTLMESSQLQQLLDAPFVSQRKVNVVDEVSDSNKNDRVISIPSPIVAPAEKHKYVVFRTLVRFMYFSALTTAQISKYHINSLTVGSPYQQALIGVNGRLCNVYGPLLETLFSDCTPSLRADLQFLLSDIGEFNFNDRKRLGKDSTEDLRTRVIYAFMGAATPFAHFRLNFENDTREWAACSVIDKRDNRYMKRKPKCDVSSVIRPEILERMKKVKRLLNSRP